jgi:selenide, water dikinase
MNVQRAIEKRVVLVGAGNAHLMFVTRWAMSPVPGVAVTLVNDAPVVAYSAMVPAQIAGEYSRDAIAIDLVRLCAAGGVRFLGEPVTAIDPVRRSLSFADRPELTYDLLSLGLGSIPQSPTVQAETSLAMRPLSGLIDRIDRIAEDRNGPTRFVVVGGGASGCELALAIHKRLSPRPGFGLSLIHGTSRLLPKFPEAAARHFQRALRGRGIAVYLSRRVVGVEGPSLRLDNGESIPFDAIVWATDPAPPPVLQTSGLSLDAGGFLRVRPTLQSVGDPAVFGTGDCVAFDAFPDLPRNGVHAVRQGELLFDNIAAALRERPLREFRPQRRCLSLLNTADGEAVLTYGSLTWKSRRVRRWKDRIDRRWMKMFQPPEPMAGADADPESAMRCGGCGSKISADVLGAVLNKLAIPDDPRVPLGCRAGEDAAVFRHGPGETVEVQTVDFFKSFTPDAYLFGRVAALHAVSDLYAMNARPASALAIATLPHARGPVQEEQLHEMLSGATREFRDLGITLAGGHTTEGADLALGFAITGFAEESRLFRKSALRVGDALILTKPLGSGALLAAAMRGQCRAEWFTRLVHNLLVSNRVAGELFAATGVTACTDVTGFGLAGHLFEMLDASRVAAEIDVGAIPRFHGFDDVVAMGIVSTLQRDNAKIACRIETDGLPSPLLFDPQTSGGLLAGFPAERAADLVRQLHDCGLSDARIIGRVMSLKDGSEPTLRQSSKSTGGIGASGAASWEATPPL